MTDKRICLMNEVISGIQVIKMYTWEKPFAKLIKYIRKFVILFITIIDYSIICNNNAYNNYYTYWCCYRKEIKQIQSTLFLGIITLSFQVVQTRLQLLISLISFLLLGNNISIRKVKRIINYLLNVSVFTISQCFSFSIFYNII